MRKVLTVMTANNTAVALCGLLLNVIIIPAVVVAYLCDSASSLEDVCLMLILAGIWYVFLKPRIEYFCMDNVVMNIDKDNDTADILLNRNGHTGWVKHALFGQGVTVLRRDEMTLVIIFYLSDNTYLELSVTEFLLDPEVRELLTLKCSEVK